MKQLMMPAGISDFEKIRKEGYYYIDKSNLISSLLEQNPTVTLITRPRRFGKTIAMESIFTGAGYKVESNREHGLGRSDIIVFDRRNRQIAIFELKHSKKESELETDCDRALDQIDENAYAADYSRVYKKIYCYGVSFYKKECMVKRRI